MKKTSEVKPQLLIIQQLGISNMNFYTNEEINMFIQQRSTICTKMKVIITKTENQMI